jgi:hypothetical protein
MAKTKLLNDIAVQTDVVSKLLLELGGKLASAAKLEDAHWKSLTQIKTELDKLNQTTSKLNARISSWNGSTKLRDIFKNKADLAKARDAARQQAEKIKVEAKGLQDSFNDVVKMMQAIAKGG